MLQALQNSLSPSVLWWKEFHQVRVRPEKAPAPYEDSQTSLGSPIAKNILNRVQRGSKLPNIQTWHRRSCAHHPFATSANWAWAAPADKWQQPVPRALADGGRLHCYLQQVSWGAAKKWEEDSACCAPLLPTALSWDEFGDFYWVSGKWVV